ncbi:macro domain-containing protein [Yersinia kristensenii]|uniref:macro domain-containing protein n=1 Tax=Yersinia kristensenii TaxID=28152 RepID=UPI0005DE7835|nr:macro domain-containing protein [Yersinia kristensenii]CNL09887.1 Macro domain [Yersinia kristensenii]HEN3478692.1 macro domain-containing protein [Yersinia enterocolitica]
MIKFTSGNMFDVGANILINTVNCVGIMGAGVALAFKYKYPVMFEDYKSACDKGLVSPGNLHIWSDGCQTIINFPTKRHWKNKSKYEDIQLGLIALKKYLSTITNSRVVLPALGCGHGGLDWSIVSKMILDSLNDIDSEILVFEPNDSRNISKIENKKPKPVNLSTLKKIGVMEVSRYEQLGFTGQQFIYGNEHLIFSDSKVAYVFDSKKGKAKKALTLIIEGIKESKNFEKTILVIYRVSADLKIINELLSNEFNVVILLPFGFLSHGATFIQQFKNLDNILFISPFKLSEEWKDSNVLYLISSLVNNGFRLLSSDENPVWLNDLSKITRNINRIYLIKYEDTEEYLEMLGLNDSVKLIGKSAITGKPNLKIIYHSDNFLSKPIKDEYHLTYNDLKKVMTALELSGIEDDFDFYIKFKGDPLLSLSVLKNILS